MTGRRTLTDSLPRTRGDVPETTLPQSLAMRLTPHARGCTVTWTTENMS